VESHRLVAHRGYPRRYPENTLVGIEAALRLGASWVEVDVQLSSDRVPVLFHDRDTGRICDARGTIHDRSLVQLGELRAAHRRAFGDEFADVRVATLDELVALLGQHPEARTLVEIKNIAVEEFGADVVVGTVLERLAPLAGRAVIISFSSDTVVEARRRGWADLGLIRQEWSVRSLQHAAALEIGTMVCNVRKMPWLGKVDQGGHVLAVYDVVQRSRADRWVRRGADLVETFSIGEMLEESR
jgi:glycerophosphoryl diester phosphodiesterase